MKFLNWRATKSDLLPKRARVARAPCDKLTEAYLLVAFTSRVSKMNVFNDSPPKISMSDGPIYMPALGYALMKSGLETKSCDQRWLAMGLP